MTRVVVFVSRATPASLTDALTQLTDAGAKVSVVVNFDLSEFALDPALGDVRELVRTKADLPVLARYSSPSRRMWEKIRHDSWVRNRTRRADLLVALDADSIHAVWELAQRIRKPQAVYGVVPALRIMEASIEEPAVTRLQASAARSRAAGRDVRYLGVFAAKRTALALVSPTVMRNRMVAGAWKGIVHAPLIPDRVRSKMANRVHGSLVSAGLPALASADTAERLSSANAKVNLMFKAARVEAAAGDVQSVAAAVDVLLARADTYLDDGSPVKAARDVYRAGQLLFHRGIQFDSLLTPLVDDTEEFLASWRRSRAASLLWDPVGRSTEAAMPPPDRPMRLLIATAGNVGFIREIREHYESMPDVEVRFVNLADDPAAYPSRDPSGMIEHRIVGRSLFGNKALETLGPVVEWADVVFIDWCVAAAAMFTAFDPGDTRIVIRLHSFEAFSLWPHHVDFSRVDDLIFVSEHLRALTNAVLPHLELEDSPDQHVIANAMELGRYARPKDPDARFTLGLVGISSIAKDPCWAFEVVRVLRQQDPRYRLVLMGSEINPSLSPAVAKYVESMRMDLAELEPAGAVVRMGHVSDVPGALADVGVILSTSVRESFHCALVEGAASGAVPVVRDWPFFAGGEHGARDLFPAEWIVDSPQAAAERILRMTADDETWRAEGEAARAYVMEKWDWSIVAADFDRVLLADRRITLPDSDQEWPDQMASSSV